MRIRVVAGVVAVMLLAGCATPGISPGPDVETPAAEPTPQVTEPATRPHGTLPIACEELVPAEVRAALFGASAATAQENRTLALPSLWHSGLTECRWVLEDGSGEARFWVLGDATEAYAEAAIPSPGQCFDAESGIECGLQGLVGGYWFEIFSSTRPGLSAADLAALLLSTLTDVLSAVGSPLPAWIPPADALQMPGECAALDGPEFRAAVDSPALAAAVAPERLPGSLIFELGRRSGELVCFWNASPASGPADFQLVTFQAVAGSGWSWEELTEDWESTGRLIEVLEVGGADEVLAMCSPGHCSVRWLAGGTVGSATFQRYDEGELDRARIAGAIGAWIGTLRGA